MSRVLRNKSSAILFFLPPPPPDPMPPCLNPRAPRESFFISSHESIRRSYLRDVRKLKNLMLALHLKSTHRTSGLLAPLPSSEFLHYFLSFAVRRKQRNARLIDTRHDTRCVSKRFLGICQGWRNVGGGSGGTFLV